jgi:hypothetical protein
MKCPRCQKRVLTIGPVGRTLKRLLDTQSVNCKCGKEAKYEELDTHAVECFIKAAQCPLDCGVILKSNEVYQDHFDQCDRAFVRCDMCNNLETREALNDHQNMCGREPDQCKWCKLDLLRKDLA